AGLEVLRAAGINGPYALALGVQAYDELDADSEDGYPLRRRFAETLPDVALVWAPALQGGAVLLSTRGGDYELTVGQDLSIGYAAHDRTDVELYLTESFTFRVLEEKAAVFLKRGAAKPKAR
ncbi:MAG TPA: family 1 encapsulin nanocompartment shell protein, partial [Polyangiaceae bacterium]|nr:family 1 encapsulin nanocompartment shell protein [Polyangiaceae bacterium]